jgi:glycosyltransferase involved in cell wall biosynthesis
MKIVFVNYFYNEKMAGEMDLLAQYYTVVGWAEALDRMGCEVKVVSRFKTNSRLVVNNIEYIFINDKGPPVLRAWMTPPEFFKPVAALQPDIVHLHHLSYGLQTVMLRQYLPKHTAIIVQHHGGKSMRNWKMRLQNHWQNKADGFFFTTREQGEWWFTKDKQRSKIMPVMEGATFFDFDSRDAQQTVEYKDRTVSREITFMTGNPVFLWVGRLDGNKDPLTVLNGFEILLQQFEQARAYLVYNQDELADEVKEKISRSPVLKERVHLLGAVPHYKIEAYYHSADYFVLGSHYEGSGYALSEALRCGCVPIITNIPSFRMMTNNGELGALWQPDDSNSFVAAAKKAMAKPLQEEGKKCIEYFRQALSFDAIARIALEHYKAAAAKRRSSLK